MFSMADTDYCADVLIVDGKNDLNIYKTAKGAPGSGSGCAAISSDGCCGEKLGSSCSGTNGTAEGRGKVENENGSGGDAEKLDLNDWAGMLRFFLGMVWRVANRCLCRVVQDICCQTLGLLGFCHSCENVRID